MELLLGLAGLTGLATLLQAKPLPTEADFTKATEKWNKNQKDPEANLTIGKYVTFVQGDYKLGLAYLSNSNDTTLKTLAEHELNPEYTDNDLKKVGMGDEWVIAAKKFPAISRIFYDRASDWYVQAWPKLDNAWKDKLREQGLKIAAARPPGPSRKTMPTGWTGAGPPSIEGSIAYTGSYSARLPEVDPKKAPPQHVVYSDPISVSGKKTVEISAYALSNLTDNPADTLFVHIFDKGGTGVGTWQDLIPTDLPFWRKYTIKKNIPENIVFIKVGASKSSAPGNLWFDNFSVKVDGVEMMKNGSFEQK